ncbi:MAG: murein biosynthesis integral membrane protein MurJ [Fibrobacter sp.]|mgnify:CR=1 FL=1|nr:murein biosynthesis integral membrane protein MurJ [Fibrobacter sp.]
MPKAAIIIAISMLLSRILGMVREIILAQVAGATAQKSALDLAFMIPDILNHIVSTGFLSMIFIPIFTGYLVKNQKSKAWDFFANILNVLGLFLLLLIVPAWFFMEELLLLLSATAPSPEILNDAVNFGRIILPGQLAFFAGSFLIAVQHTQKRFFWPSMTGVVYNLCIIIGGWLGRNHGLSGFAWGVPIGAFSGFLFLQLWATKDLGIKWRPVFKISDPDVRRYLSMMLPLVMGVGAMFALEFIIRSFGSNFGNSGISSLNYAYRLMYTLVAVFGFSVGVASYPDMAKLAKENKTEELNSMLSILLARMFAILVPTVLAVWLLAFPMVRILFERGAFTRENTELIASLLRWYLPAAFGLCAQAVLVRSFYAQERMWTPTIINTLSFASSLFFYSSATAVFGINSVPLVGSITALVQVSVLLAVWIGVNKRQGFEGFGRSLSTNVFTMLLIVPFLVLLNGKLAQFWQSWSFFTTVLAMALIFMLVFSLGFAMQIVLGNHVSKQVFQELLQKIRKKIPF